MENSLKKIIAGSLLVSTTSLMAMHAEQAYLYKDPRIMGMGGTNVAVGGYSTAVFSNPAGLASIQKDHGLVVELLGLGISASAEYQGFSEDLVDALDIEDEAAQRDAVLDILEKYSGEHFHAGINNYTSVSKNSDYFAWSIGILAGGDTNYMTHVYGTTANTGALETTSRVYGGVVLGFAKPYDTAIGAMDIGLSVKYVQQVSYEGLIGLDKLIDESDDLGADLQEEYERESSGVGVDIGVNYRPWSDSYWKPAFGLSVMNIGSMDMDDNYGGQPMTVNIGASITPQVEFIDKLVLAVDYVDLLGANISRIYISSTEYIDAEVHDFMKNLRVGASFGLIDTSYFATTINTGLYQGSYTAGLDLQLTFLQLSVATYEEQLGTGDVDIPDRRYMLKLGLGW